MNGLKSLYSDINILQNTLTVNNVKFIGNNSLFLSKYSRVRTMNELATQNCMNSWTGISLNENSFFLGLHVSFIQYHDTSPGA